MIVRPLIALLALASSARADEAFLWSGPAPAPGGKGLIALADGRLLFSATDHAGGRTRLRIFESRDFGKTFAAIGVADEDAAKDCDLGDAALMQSRDGRLWISYRYIPRVAPPTYAIKVATSDDGGRTWATPTVVAESRPAAVGRFSRGLWASCLFQRADGAVMCLYDDEETPTVSGFPGHQWITAKTWDAASQSWTQAATIARAHDESLLSRDGMMSVAEPRPGELFVVFESVETQPPHANVIRSVRSLDNGRTWSWQAREREIVYRTAKPNHLAISPWVTTLPVGRLICVFVTDEDHDRPAVSGTPPHRIPADVKAVTSDDGGRTWSAAQPVAVDSHACYLPGVASRQMPDGSTEVFVAYLDFKAGRFLGVRATLSPPRAP